MNQEEPETEALVKHYRLTLDFRVLARPITTEVCQESFFYDDKSGSEDDPYFRDNIKRLRRLYKLLLSNQVVLEQYLLSVITQEAGRFAYEGLMDAFDAREADETIVPLFKSMAEDDRQFFEECREMDVLAENMDLIATAFRVEWVGAEIGETSRRVIGDVQRAEIVQETKTRLIRDFNSLWHYTNVQVE